MKVRLEKMKNIKNKLKMMIALIIILIVSFFVYEIFFSMENPVVKEVIIENKLIPKSMDNFKIGVISDIKYQKFMDKERLSKMIDTLNKQEVDVVLFLGDLYNNGITNYEEPTHLIKLLQSIKAKSGKFYVYGETDNIEHVGKMMYEANFELLENKETRIYRDNNFIQLIGTNIKNETAVFETAAAEYFTLVMSHYPEIADKINEKINYVVSGHTLGKQINIPIFSSFGKVDHSGNYVLGEYNLKINAKLYVNGGLGTVNNDIRLFSAPEITVLKLKSVGN